MAATTKYFERVRALFLTLPDTEESVPWESPHDRVKDRIFAGLGDEGEHATVGFKMAKEHAKVLIESDDRAGSAWYVGKRGSVSFELRGRTPWKRIEGFIEKRYRLIAPRRSGAKSD